MAAIATPDAGKAIMQVSTVQVTVNYLLDVWAEKAVPSFEPVLVNLLKDFKIVLDTLIIG